MMRIYQASPALATLALFLGLTGETPGSSDPACRLSLTPAHITTRDTVAITLSFSGLPFTLSAGSVRFTTEVLGRSLRIRADGGRSLRFRNIPIHMLGQYQPDTVHAGTLQYHMRFPTPLLRLVDSADAAVALAVNADNLGAKAWAAGSYIISAEEVLKAVAPTRTAGLALEGAPLDSLPLSCPAVQLRVDP